MITKYTAKNRIFINGEIIHDNIEAESFCVLLFELLGVFGDELLGVFGDEKILSNTASNKIPNRAVAVEKKRVEKIFTISPHFKYCLLQSTQNTGHKNKTIPCLFKMIP